MLKGRPQSPRKTRLRCQHCQGDMERRFSASSRLMQVSSWDIENLRTKKRWEAEMVSLLQRKIGTVVTSWSILKWHTYLPIEVIVKTLGTSAHPFCCGLFQQYNLDQLSTLTYEYQCLQQFVTEGFSHTATTNHPKTTFPSRTAIYSQSCARNVMWLNCEIELFGSDQMLRDCLFFAKHLLRKLMNWTDPCTP